MVLLDGFVDVVGLRDIVTMRSDRSEKRRNFLGTKNCTKRGLGSITDMQRRLCNSLHRVDF